MFLVSDALPRHLSETAGNGFHAAAVIVFVPGYDRLLVVCITRELCALFYRCDFGCKEDMLQSADGSATEPTEGPGGDSETDDPTPDADTVDPEDDDGGGDGGGFPVAGYAGIAVAVIAVALAALAFLVYRNKQKKKKAQTAAAEAAGSKHGGKDVQVDQLHYVRSLLRLHLHLMCDAATHELHCMLHCTPSSWASY